MVGAQAYYNEEITGDEMVSKRIKIADTFYDLPHVLLDVPCTNGNQLKEALKSYDSNTKRYPLK